MKMAVVLGIVCVALSASCLAKTPSSVTAPMPAPSPVPYAMQRSHVIGPQISRPPYPVRQKTAPKDASKEKREHALQND